MKLEIFNTEPKNDVLRLRLVRSSTTGSVTLVACDASGEPLTYGKIFGIQEDGTAKLHGGITSVPGLQLDFDGKVRLVA